MSPTSKVQGGADAELDSPHAQSPSGATGAVVSEAPLGGKDTHRQPRDLHDIFNSDWQREGMPDTEFNRTYPPDAWGEELTPNARVWKIYRDRHTVSDKLMLNGWNKTLDVLLIFAGLFSAVLTAFLIESYKTLQPDYTQYVAAFLYAAAVTHNRTGGVLPTLDVIAAPDSFIQTSTTQRWTNGLWFSSLVVTLAVALLCILIKQWLDEYEAHVSSVTPSPKYWARRHLMYYRGLKTWGVPGMISFLPLLLHLSLFLFFVGLILLLRPLDRAISNSLLVMVLSIAAFYLLSLILPVWRIECPSYTPLLVQGLLAASRVLSSLLYVIRPLELRLPTSGGEHTERWFESITPRGRQQLVRETLSISKGAWELDGYVLSALIDRHTDTTRDSVNAAFGAIGAVTANRTIKVISRQVLYNVFEGKVNDCYANIPSTNTGFAITSQEQLRRAHWAIWRREAEFLLQYLSPGQPHRCISLFGIDDLLSHSVLGQHFDFEVLICQLQSLPQAGDISHGFPRRSACLLYMEFKSGYSGWEPLDLSCFLLVFWAGCFASADMQELMCALQSVETVLQKQCTIAVGGHEGQETACWNGPGAGYTGSTL